jgi:hypothetical protein
MPVAASLDVLSFDEAAQRYSKYRMTTSNSWADASVELCDSGKPPEHLTGFGDLETAMVARLTDSPWASSV